MAEDLARLMEEHRLGREQERLRRRAYKQIFDERAKKIELLVDDLRMGTERQMVQCKSFIDQNDKLVVTRA